MFDFLRNRGRSGDEKQQEALSAYLDNELAPADRDRVEQQLALNSDLRDELAEMKLWQAQMRNLPARRVPRNFTLDPALYGRSQRRPLAGAYPMLRAATAVTAFLLVIAVAANLYLGDIAGETVPQPVSVAMQEMAPAAEEAAPPGAVLGDMETAADDGFVLEETEDKEPGEVPVDVVEPEEAPLENNALDELSAEDELPAETEAAEGEELLSEKPQELLPSLDLEMVDETAQSADSIAREAAAAQASAAAEVEVQLAEEAPQLTPALDQVQDQPPVTTEGQNLQQPAVEEDAVPAAPVPMTTALGPVAMGLGLLFVFLAILTFLARYRR